MNKMNKKDVENLCVLLQKIEEGAEQSAEAPGLAGFSGKKMMASLHGLTEFFCRDSVYLEIGVFQGLTLLSNAFKNKSAPCYGIDNFSLFDDKGENRAVIDGHIKRLGISNANIINLDYEDALDSLEKYIGNKKVGLFFVDGAHDYRSQLVPLLRIVPYLADNCAIAVDDANYPHVRQATNDFLKCHPDFALLMEAYTPKHPANMSDSEKAEAVGGWWNGINIIVRDPEHLIKRNFVKEDKKELYFMSHDIFRHEFAGIAFDILRLVQSGKEGELKNIIDEHRRMNPGLFPHQNTFSGELTKFTLHAL